MDFNHKKIAVTNNMMNTLKQPLTQLNPNVSFQRGRQHPAEHHHT